VHVNDSTKVKFREVLSGIYMLSMQDTNGRSDKRISGYSFLNLVSANKEQFTRAQL
jgi:hypothetical protein